MTGKAATKSKKTTRRKPPSAAELKRQAGAAKQSGDEALEVAKRAEAQVAQIGESTANALQAISEKLDKMNESPAQTFAIATAEEQERLSREILNEPSIGEDLPEKPVNILPPELVQANKAAQQRSLDAINNPASIRPMTETEQQEVGQFEDRHMSSTGDARDSLDAARPKDSDIIVSGRVYSKEKLDHENFMHEQVCIRLHETNDETAIPLPIVNNGGRTQVFIRGREQWVKRWAVEPLLRAKQTDFKQHEIINERGDKEYVLRPKVTMIYPFAVTKDSPAGHQWVKAVLAEPG